MSTKGSLLFALIVLSSGCGQQTVAAAAQPSTTEDISFLSIIVDPDTALADTRLKRFLEKAVSDGTASLPGRRSTRFQQQTMPYGDVIRAFAEPDPNRGYLARITPYAYVAAELLGAKLTILAVYNSVATEKTTYHSYFVVRKDQFRERAKWKPESGEPGIDDVVTFLKSFEQRREPAKFVYHDRFSTSSYFLPSLYFRKHDVFAMGQSLNPHLTPIQVVKLASTSSSDLVHEVIEKQADLAAVWDGTKEKFKDNPELLFITISTTVPNDFLVASGISEETQQFIVDAIKKNPAAGRQCTSMKDPLAWTTAAAPTPRISCSKMADDKARPTDDFDAWYPWDSNDNEKTDTAREALAALRQAARQRPTPVVVRVQGKPKGSDPHGDRLLDAYVRAAKEAVRLSGTEFVLEDMDLHRRVDMTWTLESMHDGALTLTSKLDSAFRESEETFSISFVDGSDLPRRIADLVRSRLRRVRYVWPYELKYPAVLRDLDFTPDNRVLVQRISWLDPERNEYEEDTPFVARIENNTDFSKLRLSDEIKFPRNNDGSFAFDPMSNIAYRVVIGREPQASWIWVALPYCFIGLFLLACAGLAIDLRRQQPAPKGLQKTYQHIVDTYHEPWRGHELQEGAIVWSDPTYMSESVTKLKSEGSFLDVVRSGGLDFDFGPIPLRFSLLMKLGSRLFKGQRLSSDLVELSGGSAAALEGLIQFLVSRNRLSPFIGFPESGGDAGQPLARPIEWEALNRIMFRHFQQLGICDKRIDADFGGQNSPLASVVSTHFRGVIKKATHNVSLFRQTWTVREPGTPGRLVYEAELRAPLVLRDAEGSARASKVHVEVDLPPAAELAAPAGESTLGAWVFGKILSSSVEHDTLSLRIKPIAVMRDYAHQH